MTLSTGVWVKQNGAVGVKPVDARRALGSQYFEHADGVVRTGLHSAVPNFLLVTGTTGLTYRLAAFPAFVIGRAANEGAYVMTGQGTTDTAAVAAAPAAGLSRWDLIYLKQNDMEKGDANNLPVLGVAQGAAAASPSKPTASVPAGAVIVAEAQIFSGTTSTSQAPNTITQTWRYTALKGLPVPVRNAAERAEIAAPRIGDKVRRLDINTDIEPIETWTGTAWVLPFSYAEFNTSGWNVAGGQAQWDIGTMTLDGARAWNNDFTTVAGVPSGSVTVTKAGLYTVSAVVSPGANPGATSLLLRNNTIGAALASGSTTGVVWEVGAAFTRYLPANTNIRGVLYQQNNTINSANMSILKHNGAW